MNIPANAIIGPLSTAALLALFSDVAWCVDLNVDTTQTITTNMSVSDLNIGQSADGDLTVSGGATLTGAGLNVGIGSGINGTVTFTGSGTTWTGSTNGVIGVDGSGILVVGDGAHVDVGSGSGSLTLASQAGSSGTLAIGADAGQAAAAAGSLSAGSLVFGSGSGVLVFNHTDTNLTFGTALSGNGSIKVIAGGTALTGNNSGFSGTILISGGTLTIGSANALGSADLSLGGGSLATTAGFSYSGAIALNAGSSISAASGTTLTLSGTFTGSGDLIKEGTGQLTLDGTSSYTGTTTVRQGRLAVNGTIVSDVVVENGATLGGSGSTGDVSVLSGGKVAPGNSIGTLSVSGDVTFNAGSQYDIEVNSSGSADLLSATGVVTFASGSTIGVTAVNGTDDGSTYGQSTVYTIVQASGGLAGAVPTINENFAYLTASLSYDATHGYLTLTRTATPASSAASPAASSATSSGSGTGASAGSGTAASVLRFADLAKTSNQGAVATAIEARGSGQLYNAILLLPDSEPPRAFEALSGEIYPATRAMLGQSGRFARQATLDHLAQIQAADPSDTHLWSSAYGAVGIGGDRRETNGGALFGGDASPDGFGNADGAQWRFGMLLGYGEGSLTLGQTQASADIDSVTAGLYGAMGLPAAEGASFALRFGSIISAHDYDIRRSIRLSTLSDDLSAESSAYDMQMFGEAAYAMATPYGSVEPFANTALVHLHADASQERGKAAALSTAAGDVDTVVTTVGLRASGRIELGGRQIALSGMAGWQQTSGETRAQAMQAFVSGPTFATGSEGVDRNVLLLQLGSSVEFSPGAVLGVTYAGSFGPDSVENRISAKISIRF